MEMIRRHGASYQRQPESYATAKLFLTSYCAMKRLFRKPTRPFALPNAVGSPAQPTVPSDLTVVIGTTSHTTGLQPKYIVPPVPHPIPYDHLSLLVTKEGLLVRPHPGSASHVRIGWGKPVNIEEITSNGGPDAAEWEKDAAIVYGIIGILELFSGTIPNSSNLGSWQQNQLMVVFFLRPPSAGHHF